MHIWRLALHAKLKCHLAAVIPKKAVQSALPGVIFAGMTPVSQEKTINSLVQNQTEIKIKQLLNAFVALPGTPLFVNKTNSFS